MESSQKSGGVVAVADKAIAAECDRMFLNKGRGWLYLLRAAPETFRGSFQHELAYS